MNILIEYNSGVAIDKNYLRLLKDRSRQSRVYKKYQLTGLTLADILGDRAHRALYIRLAKEYDEMTLLSIAKNVASKKGIKNMGAYFMKLLTDPALKKYRKLLPKKPRIKKIVQRSLFKNGKNSHNSK